jgi:flagellar hook-length control protein FliK
MPAPPQPALAPQLSAPVVALAQSPDGDHRVTLTVSPENLGPVTVRAHVADGSIRIELHAPTDAGRDALRAILTDLRRDLAAASPHASLSLGGGDAPSGGPFSQHGSGSPQHGSAAGQHASGHSGDGAGPHTPAARHNRDGTGTPPSPAEDAPMPHIAATRTSGIDIFA